MPQKRILFIDDEEGMCRMVEAVLSDAGYKVTSYTKSEEAIRAYKPGKYDLVVTDVKMPVMDGLEVLSRIKALEPAPPVIVITAYATLETSIHALRKGAYDMLTKPFEPEELLHRIKNALRQKQLLAENSELKKELAGQREIIGESRALHGVLETAAKIAERDLPVLITGESGTGKELVARAIHSRSPRRDGPFVAINCGALPASLLEAELFGAKKGAYTGAESERVGLVQSADGGTLLLDEAGNLPENVQKVLLRFLQEREFYRVGDSVPTKVDVRLLAATNADLAAEVKAGRFREDLYYRLAVVRIQMPPLRDRKEDIPLLAAHFIKEQNLIFSTSVKGLSPEAREAMLEFDWPGNVRQLKNVIEGAMALESGDYLEVDSLSQFIPVAERASGEAGSDYLGALERFEKEYFAEMLRASGDNVEEAAERAGVNLATFYRKMKRYGLRRKKEG
jgi:DNA-binding NtrC family response regulator